MMMLIAVLSMIICSPALAKTDKPASPTKHNLRQYYIHHSPFTFRRKPYINNPYKENLKKTREQLAKQARNPQSRTYQKWISFAFLWLAFWIAILFIWHKYKQFKRNYRT